MRQQQTKMLQKSSFHCIVFIIVVVNICESMASKSSKFSSPSSSCNKTETDQCALNLIPLTNESILRNPPKTLTEINHICQNFMFPMEGCMRRYAMKCMTKSARQPLLVMLYSVTKLNKKICSIRKRKQNFLTLIDCVYNNLDLYSQLMFNLTRQMYAISRDHRDKLKFPMICW